jgi:hypothetical protein
VLFKEIIAVYTENLTKAINTKYTVAFCYGSWDIELLLDFSGLIQGETAILESSNP